MRVFLDFEASSLADESYPIEIGWAGENGWRETHLIRPAANWSDWDDEAEAIHGLARARLLAEGEDHAVVARRALEALSPHEVFVSAPSWDGKWMSVLLRGAGLPRHALRLKDSDEAHTAAVDEALGALLSPDALATARESLILQARENVTIGPPVHRALADAAVELALWREVHRLAAEKARELSFTGAKAR
jgi:hypothetical protein